MTIRKMHENDAEIVAKIESDIFSTPWSEKDFSDAVKNESNLYLVSEESEKISGYCGLWISYECADLCNMAVVKSQRGQGTGYLLLEESFRQCIERGVERIILEVRSSNEAARHLYEKTGFNYISTRKNYYKNPCEDALIMEKKLIE